MELKGFVLMFIVAGILLASMTYVVTDFASSSTYDANLSSANVALLNQTVDKMESMQETVADMQETTSKPTTEEKSLGEEIYNAISGVFMLGLNALLTLAIIPDFINAYVGLVGSVLHIPAYIVNGVMAIGAAIFVLTIIGLFMNRQL